MLKSSVLFASKFFSCEIHEKNETNERIIVKSKNFRVFRIFRFFRDKKSMIYEGSLNCPITNRRISVLSVKSVNGLTCANAKSQLTVNDIFCNSTSIKKEGNYEHSNDFYKAETRACQGA